MRTSFILCVVAAGLAPQVLPAETVVALRTLRAQTVIAPDDIGLTADAAGGGGTVEGGARDMGDMIGRETRIAIFRGQPVRLADLGDPALVERNQTVPLVFRQGALEIHAAARSLDRASAGQTLRVMNLASRAVVTGQVMPDGSVRVIATR
jgi:flagellar basal body P-ring formation protein FlgA